MSRTRTCPQCDRESRPRADNRAYPFCSARCKDADLGRWLSQDYVISSPALGPDGMPLFLSTPDDEDDGLL